MRRKEKDAEKGTGMLPGRGMGTHVAWMARDFGRKDLSLLSADDIATLSETLEPVVVEAGRRIISPGDPPDAAYIVERGEIELFVRRGGRRALVSIQGPGGVFADVPMLCGMPMPFAAAARTDSTLLKVPRTTLTELIGRHPAIALRWLASVIQRLERANRRVVELTGGGLRDRTLAVLGDELVARGGGRRALRLTQSELAALLGARRQSVNRVLRELGEDGLIRQRYGAIEVLDPERLIEVSGVGGRISC